MRVRNITSKLILLIFLSGILLVQSLATLSAQNYDYSLKITSSENDAYEQDGQMFIDSPIVAMGKEDGIYRGGYRFKLNVPQGAHIDSAKLSLAYNWESGRYTSIILYGENVGNSRAFSNTLKDISSRQLTKANVTWINLARVKWGDI